MRLYVAGESPHSQNALYSLQNICNQYLQEDQYQLEIVDVLEYPLRALDDNILVTPTLLKLAPLPASQMIGDLSNRTRVLLALGIKDHTHE